MSEPRPDAHLCIHDYMDDGGETHLCACGFPMNHLPNGYNRYAPDGERAKTEHPADEPKPTDRPLYPNVKVALVGQDANAFMMIGTVSTALRRAHVPESKIVEFRNEAMSGDYSNVIGTITKWVVVR